MAWIKTINEPDAGEELKLAYDKIKGNRGKVSNIMKIHSLNPRSMQEHLELYMTIMFRNPGLKREEKELIAVVVSNANRCPYCINHHAEALNFYWKSKERLERFLADYSSAELDNRKLGLVTYADKLTRNPGEIIEDDVKSLKELGFSDASILNINLVVSYFNFVNRIALGLGVEFSPEEVEGYK